MGHFSQAESDGFFAAATEDAEIQVRPVFRDTDAHCADLAGNICGMDTFIPSLRVGSRLRFARRGLTKMVSRQQPTKAKQQPQKQKLAPLNRGSLMRALVQMGDKAMAATV
jgi:sRNA-binding protein